MTGLIALCVSPKPPSWLTTECRALSFLSHPPPHRPFLVKADTGSLARMRWNMSLEPVMAAHPRHTRLRQRAGGRGLSKNLVDWITMVSFCPSSGPGLVQPFSPSTRPQLYRFGCKLRHTKWTSSWCCPRRKRSRTRRRQKPNNYCRTGPWLLAARRGHRQPNPISSYGHLFIFAFYSHHLLYF